MKAKIITAFESELGEEKLAFVGAAMGRLGQAAISGVSRLGMSAGANSGLRQTVAGGLSRATTALGGRTNLNQAVGAGLTGVGLLGAGAAAHKLTS